MTTKETTMKVPLLDSASKQKGTIELPAQFKEFVREDLISRAVRAIEANTRQRYGSFVEAGKGYSIDISKRRRDYKGVYGVGQSRTPRKIMSRSGTRMNWVGAFGPQTRGGYKAHHPKATKIWDQKINLKERRKAIRSAIAATMHKDMVEKRGHKLPSNYPFVVDSHFESLSKTKDVEKLLDSLGFSEELARSSQVSVRAGKGKMRGRRYNKVIGPIIIVSKKSAVMESAKNIPGIDIVDVKSLNAKILAPGTMPGRIAIWSEAAIELMKKENLFS